MNIQVANFKNKLMLLGILPLPNTENVYKVADARIKITLSHHNISISYIYPGYGRNPHKTQRFHRANQAMKYILWLCKKYKLDL
jgi:hypothetical protein